MDDDIAELKARVAEQDANEKRFASLEAENADRARENAELKASNSSLRAEVEKLKPKPAPLPRPLVEEGTKISYPTPAASFAMPSDDQLLRLTAIAVGAYPAFADCSRMGLHRPSPEQNRNEWNKQFKAAFLALGNMRRSETPDHKHYCHHWKDKCEDILRTLGRPETLYFNPWMAAVVAWGDIPYSGVGLQHEGTLVEVGLAEYTGRVASDANWRRVLETRAILRMTASARRVAPASPSRVIVSDHGGW
jgi:hypothetical protein